jgi:hypothetical protein
VLNLVFHHKGRTHTESISKYGTEDNIWTEERGNRPNRRMLKNGILMKIKEDEMGRHIACMGAMRNA